VLEVRQMTRTPNYGAADRADSLRRSFTAMRSALRSIIFNEGDCTRQDEPDVGACECAVCIAKAALEGEQDWRFDGYNPTRRKAMPREAAMIDAWRHYFKHSAGTANGTTMPMDAILARILFGEGSGPNDVTERDWYVATTIVQWLATNVGQCVLFDAGYKRDEPAIRSESQPATNGDK
jgi:hypothetical protein